MPPRTDRLAPGTAAAVLSRAAQAVPYRLPNEPAVLDQRTACRGVNLAGELIEGIACLRGREGHDRIGHRITQTEAFGPGTRRDLVRRLPDARKADAVARQEIGRASCRERGGQYV